ncbi:MAG: hypothetical protein FWH27_03580 [Planctomycetaceae bacterium]|nr:hypothetical protein [Planctomycetaceae bacterium]
MMAEIMHAVTLSALSVTSLHSRLLFLATVTEWLFRNHNRKIVALMTAIETVKKRSMTVAALMTAVTAWPLCTLHSA